MLTPVNRRFVQYWYTSASSIPCHPYCHIICEYVHTCIICAIHDHAYQCRFKRCGQMCLSYPSDAGPNLKQQSTCDDCRYSLQQSSLLNNNNIFEFENVLKAFHQIIHRKPCTCQLHDAIVY